MAVAMTLQRKRFDAPDETREFAESMGRVDIVKVGGHDVARSTFEPGWRWSLHSKPGEAADTCRSNHTGVILEGRMAVRMEGGDEIEYGPGDVFHIPPGHDAWIVGQERCVLVDFTGANRYIRRP